MNDNEKPGQNALKHVRERFIFTEFANLQHIVL